MDSNPFEAIPCYIMTLVLLKKTSATSHLRWRTWLVGILPMEVLKELEHLPHSRPVPIVLLKKTSATSYLRWRTYLVGILPMEVLKELDHLPHSRPVPKYARFDYSLAN